MPTWFLAPIAGLKLPAPDTVTTARNDVKMVGGGGDEEPRALIGISRWGVFRPTGSSTSGGNSLPIGLIQQDTPTSGATGSRSHVTQHVHAGKSRGGLLPAS
jgi:hypothetical protein